MSCKKEITDGHFNPSQPPLSKRGGAKEVMNAYDYNKKGLKGLRRSLRKNQTDVESALWRELRNKQVGGFKFFRQYSIGKYILDFYCPKRKLAIELDGDQHGYNDEKKKDETRSTFLRTKRIKVVRFWNDEVRNNLDGVLFTIREKLGLDN